MMSTYKDSSVYKQNFYSKLVCEPAKISLFWTKFAAEPLAVQFL